MPLLILFALCLVISIIITERDNPKIPDWFLCVAILAVGFLSVCFWEVLT